MNVYQVIAYLYPDIDLATSFRADEAGGAIEEWHRDDIPKPTTAELEAAWTPALKAQKLQETRRAAFAEMDALLMPGYEDRDLIFIILRRTLGDSDPRLAQLQTIWTRLQAKERDIQAAKTEAALEAISWE